MNNEAKLTAGAIIQYRKVGTARLVAPEDARWTESGWWKLEWIKAPKSYLAKNGQEGHVWWVKPSDLI